MTLTIGSLFSGIGGLDLGVEIATGGRTIWQCEPDLYCRAVLEKHWPGIPRFERVEKIYPPLVPDVDILVGGFPCQDVSQAGLREGIEGGRSGLWSEFARCIRLLRPVLVFVENVAGLLARGFDRVLGDLAALGYDAEWSCLRAADVGAPHLRRRVFILAVRRTLSDAERDVVRLIGQRGRQQHGESWAPESRLDGGEVADAGRDGREVSRTRYDDNRCDAPGYDAHRRHAFPPGPDDAEGWSRYAGARPGIRRGAHGLPRSMDARRRRARLRCLGNSVVPQQAAQAFTELARRLSE